MGGFSFKKLTFALVIAILVWASSIETCNARRGKHWRHGKAGPFSSLYKKKAKNHGHQGNVGKSKPKPKEKQPLPIPEVPQAPPQKGSKFNVLDYGAQGDGNSDDAKAFQAAWADACKVEASTMIVPSGYEFLVGPISFSGPYCQRNILFRLDSTIIAPTNANAWGKGLLQWLEFTKLVGLTIKGKGTIDGRGSVWWTHSILDDPIDNEDLLVSLENVTITQSPPSNNTQQHPETQTQPKFYDAIDQSIHIIQSLGIIEFGRVLGLEKREILDEVEIWVKKREDFVSDELKYIFELPAKSKAKVNEYENYQMLSFAKDAKYKINHELAKQNKVLIPSVQINLIDDYHAFIASIKNMIRKEREVLEEEEKEAAKREEENKEE